MEAGRGMESTKISSLGELRQELGLEHVEREELQGHVGQEAKKVMRVIAEKKQASFPAVYKQVMGKKSRVATWLFGFSRRLFLLFFRKAGREITTALLTSEGKDTQRALFQTKFPEAPDDLLDTMGELEGRYLGREAKRAGEAYWKDHAVAWRKEIPQGALFNEDIALVEEKVRQQHTKEGVPIWTAKAELGLTKALKKRAEEQIPLMEKRRLKQRVEQYRALAGGLDDLIQREKVEVAAEKRVAKGDFPKVGIDDLDVLVKAVAFGGGEGASRVREVKSVGENKWEVVLDGKYTADGWPVIEGLIGEGVTGAALKKVAQKALPKTLKIAMEDTITFSFDPKTQALQFSPGTLRFLDGEGRKLFDIAAVRIDPEYSRKKKKTFVAARLELLDMGEGPLKKILGRELHKSISALSPILQNIPWKKAP